MIERLNAALEGRYVVERQLGEGGMATVYLANDVRHDRQVAIKVLRPELAAVIGADRFVAEIKTTAALQHPHILPLFDSGESSGFLYYVMPYIEGESLRDRLDREKQLGVQESLDLVEDVADALGYAHRHGVIHRDIKPANILLHDGRPVVADFGIAVAISAAGGGRMTETGLSLGTPFYMSPEQATADRDLSVRSDVYSLACVLYEMLTGDPPHTASTAQAVLVRILTEAPRPAREARPSVPETVSAALTKALEQLPADRFESVEAFVDALKNDRFRWEGSGVGTASVRIGSGGGPGSAAGAGRPMGMGTVAASLALAVLAFATGWTVRRPAPESSPGSGAVVRMPFESGATIHEAVGLSLSPDGSMVAYSALSEEGPIRIHSLDGSGDRVLPETQGGGLPVFSPSGQEVLYQQSERAALLRVGIDGGSPIPVLEGAVSLPWEWTEAGGIIASHLNGTFRIREGSPPELVDPATLLEARFFRTVPGGRWLTYTWMPINGDRAEIRVLDLESGESRVVVDDGFDARYLPTGHLVYGRFDQSLVAVPFDPASAEVIGPSFTVMDSVLFAREVGLLRMAVAPNGTAVVIRGGMTDRDVARERMVLVTLGENGDPQLEVLPIAGGSMGDPSVSPDGRFLAYSSDPGLVVYEFLTGRETRLEGELALSPVWSPDGTVLAYLTFGSGGESSSSVFSPRIWEWTTESETRRLPVEAPLAGVASWNENGTVLLIIGDAVGPDEFDLWYQEGLEGEARPYLEARWAEADGQISPDGEWVVYTSNETGEYRVYARTFPEPGGRVGISDGPGDNPRWTPDGRGVYYRAGDSLWLAELERGPDLRVVSRRPVLARSTREGELDLVEFNVLPDGRLVTTLRSGEESAESGGDAEGGTAPDPEATPTDPAPPRAYLIMNWFEEVRRRAGGLGGS